MSKLFPFLCLAAALIGTAPIQAVRADQPPPVAEAAPALEHQAPLLRWELLTEVVKQTADQPLHFVMSAAPIWLSRCLTAVPWYGWAAVPALAYREWRQWPSKRWWDPPLDAAFLILGVYTATWSARPSLALAALRRRDGLAVVLQRVPDAFRRPVRAGHASS